ncbi:MAG: 2-nitropropane dioxygenase [Cereibacter sphaeroides]|uniref:Propionate 3-nitronate monooxygenase n=1 Tax=Cereibacter sphaeroides TaxID=1063 RepID=A0A2W5SCB3_CERSP|nr:MAG: 2-nitropropane dioxygenase [Cereibacter sphaeroides]
MWADRRLLDLLGIAHPIIQAPMLGTATPELAAAVSEAGGLGSIGCGTNDAALVEKASRDLRRLTDAPFNLNFFVLPEAAPFPLEKVARLSDRLRPDFERLDAGSPPQSLPGQPAFPKDEVINALAHLRPRVVSFHFGCPAPSQMERLRLAGIVTLATATTVSEAEHLASCGIDAIIAQGWEAGGHRGSHRPNGLQDGIGTLALVPQIVDAVALPVIAAGGIADGRGIAAALALGASAVQMGTAFTGCPEAATEAERLALLRQARDTDTMMTDAFSGRAARAVRSPYALAMTDLAAQLPAYPAMYAFSDPLVEAGAGQEDPFASFHLYGQAARLTRFLPASELVGVLVAETQARIAQLSR